MPIYEYCCEDCKSEFEQLRSIRDTTVPQCPSCQSASVRRLMSMTSFRLEGTGWYATDYASKPGGSTHSEGKSAASTT